MRAVPVVSAYSRSIPRSLVHYLGRTFARPFRLSLALTLALPFGLLVSSPVQAGLDEGIAAFEAENYETAVSELMPLAKAGQVKAMTWLGRVYADGLEAPAQAFPWFLKAAQKGDAEAQTSLGELYAEGLGVEQDEEQALIWFEKAAQQGDEEAQLALGVHQEEVLADNPAALVWYEKSAAQNNPEAQYRLGLLLLGEPGIKRNVTRAWMLLSLAAESEIEDAVDALDVLDLGMTKVEKQQALLLLQQWKRDHPQ